jgi:hypothetical protein
MWFGVNSPFSQTGKSRVGWIGNQSYSPCEEIFPNWKNARKTLDIYIDNLGGWKVDVLDTRVKISLINDEYIYVSEEDKYTFLEIWESTLNDYLPDMDDILGIKVTSNTENEVLHKIYEREQYITSIGGNPLKEELRFRLGITPFPKER